MPSNCVARNTRLSRSNAVLFPTFSPEGCLERAQAPPRIHFSTLLNTSYAPYQLILISANRFPILDTKPITYLCVVTMRAIKRTLFFQCALARLDQGKPCICMRRTARESGTRSSRDASAATPPRHRRDTAERDNADGPFGGWALAARGAKGFSTSGPCTSNLPAPVDTLGKRHAHRRSRDLTAGIKRGC